MLLKLLHSLTGVEFLKIEGGGEDRMQEENVKKIYEGCLPNLEDGFS